MTIQSASAAYKADSASSLEGYSAKNQDQAETSGLEITDNTSRVVLTVRWYVLLGVYFHHQVRIVGV